MAEPDQTSRFEEADRELLVETLLIQRRRVVEQHAPVQLLHGEPHLGDVLGGLNGPLFIDLETCCRGPVEFDLAHAPEEVAEHYPGVDHDLPRGRELAADWLGQLPTLASRTRSRLA